MVYVFLKHTCHEDTCFKLGSRVNMFLKQMCNNVMCWALILRIYKFSVRQGWAVSGIAYITQHIRCASILAIIPSETYTRVVRVFVCVCACMLATCDHVALSDQRSLVAIAWWRLIYASWLTCLTRHRCIDAGLHTRSLWMEERQRWTARIS